MKAKEVLKVLRVTRPTLHVYLKTGKIRGTRMPNGYYEYNEDDVYRAANLCARRKAVVYARVSTPKQKGDLQRQVDAAVAFANANGYEITDVYKDVASGLSYDRGTFGTLVRDIINHQVSTVFITDTDRLTRVSYGMWEQLFNEYNCKIMVLNSSDSTSDDEGIFQDIISLLHCFAMKMYSKRRKRKIQMIEDDLKYDLNSDEQ